MYMYNLERHIFKQIQVFLSYHSVADFDSYSHLFAQVEKLVSYALLELKKVSLCFIGVITYM